MIIKSLIKNQKIRIKDRYIMNLPINQTGKRIQNYVFNYSDFLGAGNFSKCYKGYNEVTKDIVAIKIIELNSLKSKKLEQLLFQEIEILKKLNHPSVLKCYEIFTSNRNCYIITELCNQGNLENHLKIKKTYDQIQANPIIKDVYEGLIYLAQNNIVHRDLKSANIFLHNGRAKIADFGFAKEINHNFKDLNIGSPLYMAPQGILHNVYGPKTEVWALGILVYELFHGSSPYIYCRTQEQLKRSVTIPLNWNQLRADISQDIKEFILTCLQINEQNRASIEQLANLGYIRRLNQIDLKLGLNRFDARSPSKSVHLVNNQENQRNVQPQFHRVNNNFRLQNDMVNRDFSVNKNHERQMVFKSVDMRGNHRHNTYDFQSPKRPSVLGPVNKFNFNSPTRRAQTMNPQRPMSSNNSHFMRNAPNMLNSVNQSLNINQSFQFPVLQASQQNMVVFPNQTIQKPGEFLFIEEVYQQDNRNRPVSSFKNHNFKQNSFDPIGYNSMKGFYSVNNQLQGIQNINTAQPQFQQNDLRLQERQEKTVVDQNTIQPVVSYVFKSKINFKEAIFFIHHCRLIFKFLYLYKETSYFDEEMYLRIFQYLLSMLKQLNKLAENNKIVVDGQKAGLKIKKFRQVNIEYLAKYTKQLDENNYNVIPEAISKSNVNEINSTLKQVFERLDEGITIVKRKSHLNSSDENLIILGHLCVIIVASFKEIESGIETRTFKKLLQFKQIQTVLNTPKQEFTIASYKNYCQKFIL